MTSLLLAVLLFGQDFKSELRPTTSAPVTLEVTRAKAGFEALARTAGLNVLFDPDFQDTAVTPAVRIENATVLDALNTLSGQTHNFFEALDKQSIIVAPDNPAKHSQYDPQVIKTFYISGPPRDLINIVAFLRIRVTRTGVSSISSSNAIIIRENANRVAEAEKLVADIAPLKPESSGSAVVSNALGYVLFRDAGGTHITAPGRTELEVSPRPFSFKMTGTSQAIFETVARTAGLNIVFDREFRSAGAVSFNVENVNAVQALDLLALQTKTFWEALNGKTILIAPDTPAKRQNIESLIVKTFTLGGTNMRVRLTETLLALRTLLNMKFVDINTTTNTLTVRGTGTQLALAEKIIQALKDPAGPMSMSAEAPTGSESGLILRRRAVRSPNAADSELERKVTAPITLETKSNVRAAYEDLARIIGVQIRFEKGFQETSAPPLKLQGLSAADALDFFSLHTGNIWEMGDANTVIVFPDAEAALKEHERKSSKSINVGNLNPQGITALITTLKNVLGLTQIEPAANAIQITDTPENISLAQKVVTFLSR